MTSKESLRIAYYVLTMCGEPFYSLCTYKHVLYMFYLYIN